MKPRRQREHPEARAELRAAAHWYERRGRGVGQRLLDNSLVARESIAEAPESWHRYPFWGHEHPIIRMRSIPRYPYDVIYFATDVEIVIVAYAHESKEPGYWKHRVED